MTEDTSTLTVMFDAIEETAGGVAIGNTVDGGCVDAAGVSADKSTVLGAWLDTSGPEVLPEPAGPSPELEACVVWIVEAQAVALLCSAI